MKRAVAPTNWSVLPGVDPAKELGISLSQWRSPNPFLSCKNPGSFRGVRAEGLTSSILSALFGRAARPGLVRGASNAAPYPKLWNRIYFPVYSNPRKWLDDQRSTSQRTENRWGY